MPKFQRDLVIPHELLNEFKVTVREFDKKHWQGIWPVDANIRKIFEKRFPELYADEKFVKNYDLAMVYKGRRLEKDFNKMGFKLEREKIIPRIIINGIPVPWYILRRLDLDYRKFDFVFTPKQF